MNPVPLIALALVSVGGGDYYAYKKYSEKKKPNSPCNLTPMQELSTMPETITAYSDASEVTIDPTWQYVIVSNRYTDLMRVYRIAPPTGYLRIVSFASCLGKTPRPFCFAPNGRFYVANEDSGTIVEFTFDAATGQLTSTLNIVQIGSPVCINFL